VLEVLLAGRDPPDPDAVELAGAFVLLDARALAGGVDH
jgi:hypothetical protein